MAEYGVPWTRIGESGSARTAREDRGAIGGETHGLERPPRVLVVDDEKSIVRAVTAALQRRGHVVVSAADGGEALPLVDEADIDVVLCDVQMPGMDGLELLAHVKRLRPGVEVIIMTAYGTVEWAVRAVKQGAYDFLTKPFEDIDGVGRVVERAAERKLLLDQTRRLQRELDTRDQYEGIVGASAGMRELYEMIESVSYSDATVLVQGESGTGKELVAKALHFRSPRTKRPFVALNCSALTETLLESELFGHVKGAFTGAVATKRGLFEAADGGTLFLDEVGDLSATTQVKLLRVLQEGEVRRVGSNETVRVDVRIIAATNVDLRRAMAESRFREDLYYRLNVINLTLPPLRERVEDIPLLAHHFLRRYNGRMNKGIRGFAEDVMEILQSYRWVGNVRELENVVERAVVLERSELVTVGALPPSLRSDTYERNASLPCFADLDFAMAKKLAVQNFERQYAKAIMARSSGNVSEASRQAGMDRSNFRRILKKHGLHAPPDGDE